MSNPWLDIPLAEYEGHMSLPEVGQAHLLAEIFDRAVKRWSPVSIALIGCAGGNGFERLAAGTIDRLVGVDLNPDYIEQARRRHAQRLSNIELLCADIQSQSLMYGPVDFTYAALLFEYVDMVAALDTLKRNSRPVARPARLLHEVSRPRGAAGRCCTGRVCLRRRGDTDVGVRKAVLRAEF